jgi:protein-S-isoprenylcysteine O-methyltransferase Ste14
MSDTNRPRPTLAQAKKTAIVISCALLVGIALFAVVVAVEVPITTSSFATAGLSEYRDTPSIAILLAAVLGFFLSLSFGRRMYDDSDHRANRAYRALTLHIYSQACAEAPALAGLVLVLLKGTWSAALPFLIGLVALVAGVVRGSLVFDRIAAES